MEVSWVSNTFEQFKGITFYMKKTCPEVVNDGVIEFVVRKGDTGCWREK